VIVRRAAEEDEAAIRALWEAFEAELPEPEGFTPSTWEDEWPTVRANMREGGVYLAAEGDEPVGLLDASAAGTRWHVETVYVRPESRRQGVASELLRACVRDARERAVEYVSLEVLASNEGARTVWQRLGFAPLEFVLGQPLDALELRLAEVPRGRSHASTHVQTNDRASVERALAQFLPRLTAPVLDAEASGWLRIVDPVLDDDREAQSRFAGDLSDRLGAAVIALAVELGMVVRYRLYERGLLVDEYLSVPTFYAELPMVDQLALHANPTLVARVTGADRDEVHRVVRTAASASELPPAEELYAQVVRLMGLEA
jgi:ribosomal protein S18 acetylase RimI-like enzyme